MKKYLITFITLTVISFMLSCFLVNYNIIKIPDKMQDYQFNIVTISTVFAGFSFSVLGILFGLTSNKTMRKLEQTTVLPKSCEVLIYCIVLFLIVFFIALYFLLGIDQLISEILQKLSVKIRINTYVYMVEICYLLFGVIYFIRSVYRMSYMVYYIFKEEQSEAEKKIQIFNEAKINKDTVSIETNEDDWDF